MSFDDHLTVRRMSSSENKTTIERPTHPTHPTHPIHERHEEKQKVIESNKSEVNINKSNKDSLSEKKRLSLNGIHGIHGIHGSHSSHSLHSNEDNSLFSSLATIRCIVFWYFFSFTTLFLNKYIVSYEKGDTIMLGVFQLMFCAICSAIQLKYWPQIRNFLWREPKRATDKPFLIKGSNFSKNLLIVGCLRFSTILLGLIALWFVEVSFAETVKSSAPVFTVLISRLVLGERTSLLVNLSLIPVMSGLALCSAFELSFTLIGFIASLATNLSECFQNVFSKKLLSVEQYEPSHLQFYTSFSSIVIQIPFALILVDLSQFWRSLQTEDNLLITYILAGISFHCQSYTEYILLSLISPVTHSVANTAKRALLIWLSVLIFGNPVTGLSWIGTGFVISGVFIYNKAREMSPKNKINSSLNYTKLVTNETHDV